MKQKLYTKNISKCEECPNILRVPSISPNVINEMQEKQIPQKRLSTNTLG